jgi:hypothetical protein
MEVPDYQFRSIALNVADDEKVAGRGHDAYGRDDAGAHFINQFDADVRRGPHPAIIAS